MDATLEKMVDAVFSNLAEIDENKLVELNTVLVAAIKERRKNKDWELSKQFRNGEEIEWKDHDGVWYDGTIKTVNERTVSLVPIDGVKWRVAFKFIRKKGEGR